MKKEQKTSIFIIDDHAMVREGLKLLLNQTTDFRVVGEDETTESALVACEKLNPEILLLDVRLKGESGLDACALFKKQIPEMKVVILTSFVEPGMVVQALDSGADGYLLKEIGREQLCDHLRRVAAGETVIPGDLAKKMMTEIKSEREDLIIEHQYLALTSQEKRVAEGVAQGLMNKEIAHAMSLSEKTVKNYLTNIFMKLGISRRSQLAVLASRQKTG